MVLIPLNQNCLSHFSTNNLTSFRSSLLCEQLSLSENISDSSSYLLMASLLSQKIISKQILDDIYYLLLLFSIKWPIFGKGLASSNIYDDTNIMEMHLKPFLCFQNQIINEADLKVVTLNGFIYHLFEFIHKTLHRCGK